MKSNTLPVALITGSAKRIGAILTRHLHQQSYRVVVHYRHSETEAFALIKELNDIRPHSAIAIKADLDIFEDYERLVDKAVSEWGCLDTLINNASSYFPTPVGNTTLNDWDKLINSNLRSAYFISQAAAAHLRDTQGSIINIIDVNGRKALPGHSVYSIAKAGLIMMTQSLAKELGPDIRVNAISPGITMWSDQDNGFSEHDKQAMLENTILKRLVDPADIAKAVSFFIQQQSTTGQVLEMACGKGL